MKHIHLLLVAFALSSSSLLAQTTVAVQGSLKKTTDRTPVDFANVLLRHPADSSLVVGTTSDEHGAFRLEAPEGTFLLEVRALGYRPYHQTLTIAGALDLGELLLTEETKQLSAVQVTGRRPIMLRKADRLVFDATQIAPAAASALDVLRQTPGVNVTNSGISLIGKGGVIVLVNDKRVRLSGTALLSLLRSYPQSDLQEIQILTTPPAKYEAEGDAGVLNLVLKKAKNDFFGGSVTPGFGINGIKRSRPRYELSTSFNYNQGKVTVRGCLMVIRVPIVPILSRRPTMSVIPTTLGGISYSAYVERWTTPSLQSSHSASAPPIRHSRIVRIVRMTLATIASLPMARTSSFAPSQDLR